jgi:hypothetical protein
MRKLVGCAEEGKAVKVNIVNKSNRFTKPLRQILPQTVFSGTIKGVTGLWMKMDTLGFVLRLWMEGDHRVVTSWNADGTQVENYHEHKDVELIVRD